VLLPATTSADIRKKERKDPLRKRRHIFFYYPLSLQVVTMVRPLQQTSGGNNNKLRRHRCMPAALLIVVLVVLLSLTSVADAEQGTTYWRQRPFHEAGAKEGSRKARNDHMQHQQLRVTTSSHGRSSGFSSQQHQHDFRHILRATSPSQSSSSLVSSIIFGLRGGSSAPGPFSPRVAPRVVPRPTSSKRPPSSSSWTSSRSRTNNDNNSIKGDPQFEEDQYDASADVTAKEMMNAFLTRDSRNSFIARVYAILSCQLVFTAIVCIAFGTYTPLTNISMLDRSGHYTNPLVAIPLGGILLSTIAWFRICASPQARQKSPNKWWWLSLFTVGEALSLGCLSSLYDLKSVILAMGATAVAAVTVSAYTILQTNSKYDLSQWGATLSSWAMILLVYLLVGLAQNLGWLPTQFIPYTDMAYSAFASVLFSLFLAHHTKLIVGGKHSKYRMNEKDYVFGAMALYVDIVNIFLNILQLIGNERDNK
jgi:protein lifeguard